MDRVNYVRGQVPPSADLNKAQEGAETVIDRLAKAVVPCRVAEGLTLDLTAGEISAGLGYDPQGRRVVLPSALAADLSTVMRPGAGMVKWVAVALRWVRAGSGDVYDRNNVRHDRYHLDSAQLVLTEGAEATDEASAARPDFGDVLPIAEVLLDEATPIAMLTVDTSRRKEVRPIPTNLVTLDLLPGAPDNFALTVANHLDVTLSWWWPEYSGGSQVTTFQVELVSGGVTTVLTERVRALTYQHRAAASDDTVCYRVRARNWAGLSAVFADSGVTTGSTDPQAPRSLSLFQQNRSSSLVRIEWAEPSGGAPDSYRIEASLDYGVTWQEIAASVLSPQDYTAGAETNLRVRVWAVTGGSDVASTASMISLLPIGAPLPTATEGDISASSNTSITVRFDFDSEIGADAEMQAEITAGPNQATTAWGSVPDFAFALTAFNGPWSTGNTITFRVRLRRRGGTIRTVTGAWSAGFTDSVG